MPRPPQASVLLVAGLAACLAVSRADEIRIGIGAPVSVVRETVSLAVQAGRQTLHLPGLPAEADPSSLQVRFPPGGAELEGWRVAHAATPAVTLRGADAVWQPGTPRGPEDVNLDLTVVAPAAGSQPAELTYLTTGLAWSVTYSVLVRGDLSNEEERASLDLTSRIHLENNTGRTFPGARLFLVGEDRAEPGRLISRSGILMMDDEPLGDLWTQGAAEPLPRFTYRVSDPVTLSARGAVDVVWLRVLRRPAERLYRMGGDEVAGPGDAKARPLNRWLEMEHGAAGDAVSLPAGRADIFTGAQRSTPSRNAWISHTPVGDPVRIDLGPTALVTGERRLVGRTRKVADSYEETRQVSLANRLATPIRVEVEERPPTTLEWEMVRSTAPSERRGRRLLFTVRVGPHSALDVRYTLRIREPVI